MAAHANAKKCEKNMPVENPNMTALQKLSSSKIFAVQIEQPTSFLPNELPLYLSKNLENQEMPNIEVKAQKIFFLN